MSDIQLLPCPFCGGKATVERGEIPGDYMVVCRECFIGAIHSERESTPEMVAQLWNKRYGDGNLKERLEERDKEIVAGMVKDPISFIKLLFPKAKLYPDQEKIIREMWEGREFDVEVKPQIIKESKNDTY